MRNIALLLIIFLLVSSCKKDDCPNLCISNIEDDIVLDIHYNRATCSGTATGNDNFQWRFNSEQEFRDFICYPGGIPFELNFEGIIIAQGVRVPFVGPNGGDPGYSLDVSIQKDTCVKQIDFKFILTTIDTSRVFEHNENVIVLLNGIDSTYTVNFSHEIIPYSE